jgi:low affinity Fe/Cu permease
LQAHLLEEANAATQIASAGILSKLYTSGTVRRSHGKAACLVYRAFKGIAQAAEHPVTFVIALLTIIVWGATGPLFDYSDTWQLVINTGTTIITFLMVFLIQRTQNRDTQALHLKLDELIRVTKGARNVMLDLEHMDDEHLKRLRDIYERLGSEARGEKKEKT